MNTTDDSIGVNTKILIKRPAYKQNEFENTFAIKNDNVSVEFKMVAKSKLINFFKLTKFLNIFTILNVITEYDYKTCLLPDCLSGITVGLLNINQALAYGALTSLNPVHGLSTSIFTGFTYIFFGTSRHLSVGTFAVTSLMVHSTILDYEHKYPLRKPIFNSTNGSSSYEDAVERQRVQIAITLSFFVGIVQIIMGLINFGTISKYMSTPLLRGFTTAAAFHVFTSQIQHVTGIYSTSKTVRKVFKLVYSYIELFQHVKSANWVAIVLSVVGIIFLIVMKIHVNERFKKQLRNIPIPVELILIVVYTMATYFGDLDTIYNLKIVGRIPNSLPQPSLPQMNMFTDLVQDSIIIAVVAFAMSISVCNLFAKKYHYEVDANKEMFAYGMANTVGSFFKCFVSCGSLTRSIIQEQSGGKTQLVTVIQTLIVLVVLLWISPLLESLPLACLGAIIIAALKNMFMQFEDLPYYWKLDKIDFVIYLTKKSGRLF
jgi:high affinity sulfate transporter 1